MYRFDVELYAQSTKSKREIEYYLKKYLSGSVEVETVEMMIFIETLNKDSYRPALMINYVWY